MENMNNVNLSVPQPNQSVQTEQPNPKITWQEMLIVILLMIIVGGLGYFLGSRQDMGSDLKLVTAQIKTQTVTPTVISTVIEITEAPTLRPTNRVITPTSIPTSTITPTLAIDEIGMIRSLVANFEKYNGAQNAAGALDYFTAPTTKDNMTRLEYLRTKNIPYTLKSWMYPMNDDDIILQNKIANGYNIYISENRDNTTHLMVFEVIRLENKFVIDKYYKMDAASGAITETLKYQGFSY